MSGATSNSARAGLLCRLVRVEDQCMRITGMFLMFAGLTCAAPCIHAEEPAAKPGPRIEVLRGKVVSLNDRLARQGITLDPDAGLQLAFESTEGKVLPLVQDAASLMFYRDARLLDRPLEVRGRVVPGTGLLQLLEVFALKNDQRFEIYYWCEVCAIKRFTLEKTRVCECCGAAMELRERKVEQK